MNEYKPPQKVIDCTKSDEPDLQLQLDDIHEILNVVIQNHAIMMKEIALLKLATGVTTCQ